MKVEVRILPNGEDLDLPAYATADAAGADLRAAIRGSLVLEPMKRAVVPCGFAMALPSGWEVQVRPRSGLAVKHGITVLNGPGTIDADYRGEVMVPLINLGDTPFTIRRGERIAQMVLAPVHRVEWVQVDDLSDTERGQAGFGSTGS